MTENSDLIIWKFIQASDYYLTKAHEISANALNNKDLSTLNNYNLLIKGSLNCLFKVLRNYSSLLDANIQSIIYYKTALILFKETISSDLALDYCIKGIQICKRNEPNLTSMKLKLQYLNFQIQFNSKFSQESKSQLLSYINNMINYDIPNDRSYLHIKIFFKFIKFKYFKSIYSNDRNIIDLQNIYQELNKNDSNGNLSFKQIVLINLIELQLLNISYPIHKIKTNLELLKSNNNNPNNNIPIQYKAIAILFDILLALREYKFDETKEKIQEIDLFTKSFKSSKSNWHSKLYFDFSINNSKSNFRVEMEWLSFKDFSMISYFYCGILYTLKSWDNKGKSDKLFKLIESSLQLENIQYNKLLSYEDIENKKLKQNLLRILICCYRLLSDFVKDDYPLLENSNLKESLYTFFKKYKSLSTLIGSIENNTYTNYEYIVYNSMIPFIHYILAIVHQRNGLPIKALYYYSKVRQYYSNSNINRSSHSIPNQTFENFDLFNDPIYADFIQTNLGTIGSYSQSLDIYNEIYIISTINSLPIIQNLIECEKIKQKNISEFDIGYDSHMKMLLNLLRIKDSFIIQIKKILENINISHNNSNSTLLQSAIQSICYFYVDKNHNFLSKINVSDIEQISPLLASFIYLILGYTYNIDPGLTELENLNLKVGYFTSACKFSKIACSSLNTNFIARLGYLEIWKIMDKNKNLYSRESIDHVFQKFEYFSSDTKRHVTLDDNEHSKRVKFI